MSAVTPIVLVDMDGPLADFDQHFWDRCAAAGHSFDIEHPHQQEHRYFTDHLSDPDERRAARAMVDSPGWFEALPVTPGAAAGMAALAELADVWICTKPLEVNPTCRDAKAAWLAEHFGSYWERRLIIAPDKSLVAGDVLLDDAPKPEWYDGRVKVAPRALWRPVIFTAPFNGVGSDWSGLPHWTWGDDPATLIPKGGR